MIFGAAFGAAIATGSSPASAQTFQSYRCSDGTQFLVGFFEYDKRAHLQIDGRAVTLARRLALTGSRYSGTASR
jgi:membrane-bound inhibitor of C-type lysozyme